MVFLIDDIIQFFHLVKCFCDVVTIISINRSEVVRPHRIPQNRSSTWVDGANGWGLDALIGYFSLFPQQLLIIIPNSLGGL